MTSFVLGVNSAYHEPSAALVADGRIVAFAEEERFNRVRHGKHSRLDNPDELPELSIAFCLREAGIGWRDLAAIGYSFDPAARLAAALERPDPYARPGGWGSEDGERLFHAHNVAAGERLRERAPQAAFRFLPHHLCHVASAFLVSPFEEAAVLVVDGIAERDSTWLGLGRGGELAELETVPFPHSLGFCWEKLSELLGFDRYSGPGKVMGYACITDPVGELSGRDHLTAMREILREESGGTFVVDPDAWRFRAEEDFSGLDRRFGPRRPAMVDRYEDASIAAALQEVTGDILVHLACRLHELASAKAGRPVRDLCLAGGVALNCVANHELAMRTPFTRIWVQPAANDAGTALGAAVLLALELGQERPRLDHPYLGPGFDAEEMRAALDAARLAVESPASVAAAAAERIERGEIVAWFQGRQEVGPRALGNRSILCDPTRFDSRNRLNARVKYRESFRPFAPSLLPQAVEPLFRAPAGLLATRYMLATLPVRERRLAQVIPAVIQENGSTGQSTARIHLVEPDANPLYAELLSELERRIGLAVVLNTSFNISEPIVTTPAQAVATFARSAMDALVMGPFLAARRQS